MKKVIIAEKPSVAKNIADAYKIKGRKDGYFEGEDYIITWAFGHLLQLYDAKDYDENMKGWRMEKFPFIPEEFKYKVKSDGLNRNIEDKGAKKQLNIIKGLIGRDDVDGIISATDFDREGQVIGDEIFLYLNKGKPVYRLLLNEWTEAEVKKGMQNLKDNKEMQSLQDAGIGRQWADWIIGINLTSVATIRYKLNKDNKILNIGRVLLPTLKIIYDRDLEIENFKASTYYKLVANFKTAENKEYEGLYYLDNSEKFENRNDLAVIGKAIENKKGKIVLKETEKKKDYPPFLFNLSNLQGHVTSKYKGWTSDKVLKVAQSLYEKKFITYPRTGSMALEESLVDRTRKVLENIKKGLPYEDQIKFTKSKRIFDNKKVESHSAIVPTYMKPNGLSADEKIVYNAVKNRFIMQFMP
ncbi:MAG: DNA topoisomerase, partial [Clostridium sp.]|uniref:DNA topoisomerase n=1 Tax=Clostridium sp. TaxID=1506 RepID=UPI003F3DA115